MMAEGIRKIHLALNFARRSYLPSHPLRRYRWVHELAFWFAVFGGAYSVYLLMGVTRPI